MILPTPLVLRGLVTLLCYQDSTKKCFVRVWLENVFSNKKKRYKKNWYFLLWQKQPKCLDSFPFYDCFLYLVILVSFLIIPYLFSILVFFFWFSWVLISEKDHFLLGLFSVIVTSWKTYVNHMKYLYIRYKVENYVRRWDVRLIFFSFWFRKKKGFSFIIF